MIHRMSQRTPEWFAVRLGKLTGSVAADMLAMTKTGESAARRDLRMALALERLTGQAQGSDYINADMQRGIDLEPVARQQYFWKTGRDMQEVGFIDGDVPWMGCSPDGLSADGTRLLEIKCPRSANHWDILKSGVPAKYLPQLTHNLAVTGAEAIDFVSFDPLMPEEARLVMCEVRREDVDIDNYCVAAQQFLVSVEQLVQDMQDTLAKRRG